MARRPKRTGPHDRYGYGEVAMEKLLDVNQVSELLSVKPATIYYWVHIGYIPHHHVRSLLRFRESEIEEWFAKVGKHNEGRTTRQASVSLDGSRGFS